MRNFPSMKGKTLVKISTWVLLIVYTFLTHFFVFQNHLVFPAVFNGFENEYGFQKSKIKNKFGKETNIYKLDRNLENNAVYFNCHGQHKDDYENFTTQKFLTYNFYAYLHRGHSESQIFRSKKQIDADIEAVGDYMIENTNSNSEILCAGHSLGTYSALKCASYILSKNRKCQVIVVDPFYTINDQVCRISWFLSNFFINEWSNVPGFEKCAQNAKVILAMQENVFFPEHAKKVLDLLERLKIPKRRIHGTDHRTSMFNNADLFDPANNKKYSL